MTSKHLRQAVSSIVGTAIAIFILGLIGCTPYKPAADLSETDYVEKDWAGKDLRDADLAQANLSGANLEGAVLSGARLNQADLSNADLRNADLRDADLRRANLQGALLAGAVLDNALFISANLSALDLSNRDLAGARFAVANLSGSNLSGTSLSHADLSHANLSRANLSNADLSGADLSAAILTEAEFLGANLSLANLEGVILLPTGVLAKAISQQAILGETVMGKLFSEACLGHPIPGAEDLDVVPGESDYVILKNMIYGGTPRGYDYLGSDTSIGNIRYVVCADEVVVILESCGDYTFSPDVNVKRIDYEVRTVDIRTGEVIVSKLLRGKNPEVDYCPSSLCWAPALSDACEGKIRAGDLMGDAVSDERIHEFAKDSVNAFEAQSP